MPSNASPKKGVQKSQPKKPHPVSSRLVPKRREDLKSLLDALVSRYKTPDFIVADPIQFPHRYLKQSPQTAEWVGFLAAMFSYGRRETLVTNIESILQRMGNDPALYLQEFSLKKARSDFKGFIYRFNTGEDVVQLLARLERVYQDYEFLEAFLKPSLPLLKKQGYQAGLADFMERFIDLGPPLSSGLKFTLAHPARGGACKRLQMYLRWMVRQETDVTTAVDLGLWQNSLSAKQLLVPMDTHVSKWARHFKLTRRLSDDWQTAEEITRVFRRFAPEDPLIYDFALFGLGAELTRGYSNCEVQSNESGHRTRDLLKYLLK
jgi:uncharacterized protein (TIGR02757 family)